MRYAVLMEGKGRLSARLIAACAIVILCAASSPAPLLAQSDDDNNDYDGWRGGRSRSYGLGDQGRANIAALGDVRVEALPIPVLLGVELSNLTKNFGDPRDGGTRTHEGLDMLAPEGTPIASPTDAVVVRTGNGSGSGLFVRTVNPGGESFVYMHLVSIASNIQEGSVVKRGDVIGFVGNTGNASGGPAHLHFEIRMDGAQDPYPRLMSVFTLEERMRGITQALLQGGANYISMYATKFRATFDAARAQGLTVPDAILSLLNTAPPPVATPTTPSVPSANETLVFGKNNSRIAELQQFLIDAASGSDAAYLARSGATGYFGPITKAALIEYQRSAGLATSGVVDDATYTQIFALAGEGDSSETEPVDEPVAGGTLSSFVFTRDLELGMTGEDVRRLQQFLNAPGFLVAETDAGSPGQETTYFGALTQKALARYQASNSISPAAGYFGPITRAKLALLI